MSMAARLCAFACIASLALVSSSAFAQLEDGSPGAVYSIILNESSDEVRSRALKESLERKGVFPSAVVPTGSGFATMAGEFGTFAEAEVHASRLEAAGLGKGRIHRQELTAIAANPPAGLRTDSQTTVSRKFRFSAADAHGRGGVHQSDLQADAEQFDKSVREAPGVMNAVLGLSKAKKTTDALVLLETHAEKLRGDDKTFAMAELGRLRALAKRPQEEIVSSYMPVADGTLPAPRLMRERAAAAVAHALRYGTNGNGVVVNKPIEALEAFLEVAEHAADESARSEAAVECVALTLEAVKGRRAGDWSDVRVQAARARAAIPEHRTRNRATVELMVAESYFYQGRYNDAALAAELLLRNYPDERREVFMARITAALAYRKLRSGARAHELLEANVAEAGAAKRHELFAADLATGKRMDVRSMSLQWLIIFARVDRDSAAEMKWSKIFADDYPQKAIDNGLQDFVTAQ
jgi:hypothetical protein